MIICEFGNPIVPNFSISLTRNKQGVEVMAISVLGSYQELNMEQVKFLKKTAEDWITGEVLEKQMEQGLISASLRGWDISAKINDAGKKVLAISFPLIHVELTMCQALRLIGLLKGWLDRQDRENRLPHKKREGVDVIKLAIIKKSKPLTQNKQR